MQAFPLNFLSQSLLDSIEQRYTYKGLNLPYPEAKALLELIQKIYSNENGIIDNSYFKDLKLKDIIHFLSVSHYYYTNKIIPEIELSLDQALRHNDINLHLWKELFLFFNSYKKDLFQHIEEEETFLFPALLALEETYNNDKEKESFLLNFDKEILKNEHGAIEDELANCLEIIKLYENEKKDLFPLNVFMNQISRFEIELRHHAYIEDLLMFPLAQKYYSEIS